MWAIRWVEGLSAGGLWEGFLVEVNIVLAVGASAGVAQGAMNCCGAGLGNDVGVGLGDPERGSGWRVRVGVVERGGVLVRLLRGVPPMGEGKSRGCSWCVGRVTVGVGMRLTYCQRS